MTARPTQQADEIAPETYILDLRGHTQRVVFGHTVGGSTKLLYATNEHWMLPARQMVELATDEEAQEYEDQIDRAVVVAAIRKLAQTIEEKRLTVPSSLKDVKVDFTLHDSADLSGWAEVLRRRPVKHQPSLLPSMSSDALGLDVVIVGGSAEFGPDDLGDDLADAARAEAERRDTVGAFPGVAKPAAYGIDREGGRWHAAGHVSWQSNALGKRTTCSTEEITNRYGPVAWFDADDREIDGGPGYDPVRGRAQKPKPAPEGWPLGDNHRPAVDEDTYRADRYSGEG